MNRFRIFIILGILLGTISCSKEFLEADLQASKKFDDGIKTARDMHNLVKGVYNRMNNAEYYGRDFLIFGEIRSDNAFNDEGTGRFTRMGRFDMLANDGYALDTWNLMYSSIQLCNVVIQNTTVEETDEVKYYKGQALALRALVYFDLNRAYGQAYLASPASPALGVPIVTVFDNTASTAALGRATYAEVNTQIEKDFDAALLYMGSNDYSDGRTEITADAVKALKGRFLLYQKRYAEAISILKPIVESSSYNFAAPALYESSWTLPEASESLFELAYTSTDYHGTTSYTYMWANSGYKDVFMTKELIDLYADEDVRFPASLLTYGTVSKIYSLVKYPFYTKDHNQRIIGLGEVYLNYIEACVESGTDLTDALKYANKYRAARFTTPPTAWTAADLTQANVRLERRLELATEGHRYFDLCRYGSGTTFNQYNKKGLVIGTITVPDNRLAFPIPEAEMDANPNLVNQNPGY